RARNWDGNLERQLSDRSERRQQVGIRIAPCRRLRGDCVGRRQKHAVGNPPRAHRDRTKPDPRIDIGVVVLIDAEFLAAALDRRERTARGGHPAAPPPRLQLPPPPPPPSPPLRHRQHPHPP